MTHSMTGKVALVTGGSSGIGKATALAFAAERNVSTTLRQLRLDFSGRTCVAGDVGGSPSRCAELGETGRIASVYRFPTTV